MTSIYSARWVLPIVSPAIDYGAVAVEGATIAAVGPAHEITSRFPHAGVVDFGEAVILPGLVNSHSHLELTVMRGFLESEEHDFFSWLRKLTIARLAMTAEDLFVSAMCGSIEAARAGITCLGDSSSVAVHSMKALRDIGLRGIVYQESFGPDPNLAHDNVSKLRDQLAASLALENSLVSAGVSPHAPYTVSGPQIELISRLAIDEKLPVMMHAAESQAEKDLLRAGTGAFAAGLQARGIEWQAPGLPSIQYLARHGILETRPLLAHCVTVDDDDIELIKNSGSAIAHCPKSNAKLGHGRAPFAKFVAANLRVGLGSDSVASNNNCDILEEARFATLLARASEARPSERALNSESQLQQNSNPGESSLVAPPNGPASDTITSTQALHTATLGGARALGLDDRIGALAEGRQADLIAVSLGGAHQQPVSDPVQTLIFSSSGSDVRFTMVAGNEIYREGRITNCDQREMLTRLRASRQKLDAFAS